MMPNMRVLLLLLDEYYFKYKNNGWRLRRYDTHGTAERRLLRAMILIVRARAALVKIIERFHLLFVSDVRTVYENFVLFYLRGVLFFWLLNQILCDLPTNKLNKLNSNQMSTIATATVNLNSARSACILRTHYSIAALHQITIVERAMTIIDS